jgi:microsomal dipeptidase-like Zn-dependent dipeptidase
MPVRNGRPSGAPLLAALVAVIACAAAPAGAVAAPQNERSTCGNTRLDFGFADSIYSALNNNGEGRIGPRRLVVNQSGRIDFRGTRLFRGATPMDVDRAKIRIVKRGGRGRTTVAICATADGGPESQTVLSEFEIPSGTASIGRTFTRTLRRLKNKRVSVYLKGKSLTDSMSYDLFFERLDAGEIWEPEPGAFDGLTRPVTGFADVHAHQAGATAYAGGWYFGPMGDGAQGPDPLTHSRRLTVQLAGIPLKELRPAHTGLAVPSWNVDSHQQINGAALKEARDNGLGLMVAPAVNSEWLCSILAHVHTTDRKLPCNDMESVKRQILEMKRFDENHDWYRIVTNPWEARSARARGELAVVLGVEVSNLFPPTDGDWRRQLDELYSMGVRQVYIAHETNNRFAGTAYHHTEDLKLPNQLTAFFSREIDYASEPGGTRNAIGLTSTGKQLVRELIRRHMLIDVDHISWRAAAQIGAITRRADYYPIYAGHSRVNELLTDEHEEIIPELNTPPSVLDDIRERGGMIGIRTGPERSLQYGASGVTENCGGSVRSFIQHYRFIADKGIPAAFGSDLNGFVTMTGPRFGPEACPDAPPGQRAAEQGAQGSSAAMGQTPSSWFRYTVRGMSDIGTEPAMIYDMQRLGVDTSNIESSAKAFIEMWTRAYDPNRQRIITPTRVPAFGGF